MSDVNSPGGKYSTFPKSREMVNEAKKVCATEQTCSPSYRLAFDDPDFLLQDEQRAVRLLLEWQKPDQILQQNRIDATWVIFGSARIHDPEKLKLELEQLQQEASKNPSDELNEKIKTKRTLLEKAHYYHECVKLARLLADETNTGVKATVVTGGGPGIMEAANRGAYEAGAPTIGLNIVLPTEQEPNRFITPQYCFQFHYFAIRKMHFLIRAKALIAFPGGFGTLDEIIETLTLMQTGRIKRYPVLLFGESFWRRIINFEALLEEGMISAKDLKLFHFVNSAEEAVTLIKDYYKNQTAQL
jgi:hypothetical protein